MQPRDFMQSSGLRVALMHPGLLLSQEGYLALITNERYALLGVGCLHLCCDLLHLGHLFGEHCGVQPCGVIAVTGALQH